MSDSQGARQQHDLVERTALALRDLVVTGSFTPGQQLSEASLASRLEVSRNTLREVFRVLMHEGLLRRVPNRGVFVRDVSVRSILDIYRVRRLMEVPAVAQSTPRHPAIRIAAAAVARGREAAGAGDWRAAGTANMEFHGALVALADSERTSEFFARLAAELRLAFVSLESPEYVHAPFIEENQRIVDLLQDGRPGEAAEELDAYLTTSERVIIAAFTRDL